MRNEAFDSLEVDVLEFRPAEERRRLFGRQSDTLTGFGEVLIV